MYEDILMIIGIVLIAVIWSLKLVHLVLKVAITVAAICLILNFFGYLVVLNQPINKMFAGEPAMSCAYDSDCTLKTTLCQQCDCGTVMNKEWEKFCPLKDVRPEVQCPPCAQPGKDFTIQCIKNICTRLAAQ